MNRLFKISLVLIGAVSIALLIPGDVSIRGQEIFVEDTVPVQFILCAQGDLRPECSSVTADDCTFTASPESIIAGRSATLRWSCYQPEGKMCVINNSVGSADPTGGSKKVKPASSITYELRCSEAGVPDIVKTAQVRVRGFWPILKEIIPR